MITKKIFYILFTVSFIPAYVFGLEGGDPVDGEKIFTQRCTACHKATGEKLIGPGLRGIEKRRPIEWIVKFIHNSEEVINSGDSYAVELFEKFGKMRMTANPDLSEAQIKNVLAYIKNEEAKDLKKKEAAAALGAGAGEAKRMLTKSDTLYKVKVDAKAETYSNAIVYFVTLASMMMMVVVIAWVLDRGKETSDNEKPKA